MATSGENEKFDDCDGFGGANHEASPGFDLDVSSAGNIESAGSIESAGVDSITWQRLVSSRLPEDTYRELLIRMECQPELWRDCALAFLEEQALREAFAEITGAKISGAEITGAEISGRGITGRGTAAAEAFSPVSSGSVISGPEFSSVRSSKFKGYAESADTSDTSDTFDTSDPSGNLHSQDLLVEVPTRIPSLGRGRSHVLRSTALHLAAAAAGFLLAFGFFAASGLDGFPPLASTTPNNFADTTTAPEFRQVAATSGSNDVDRELNDIISNLSDKDRQRLLASPSRQKIRATVPASPAIAVPGDWNSSRHFLFYETNDNQQIVVAVDSHQYVAAEVQ